MPQQSNSNSRPQINLHTNNINNNIYHHQAHHTHHHHHVPNETFSNNEIMLNKLLLNNTHHFNNNNHHNHQNHENHNSSNNTTSGSNGLQRNVHQLHQRGINSPALTPGRKSASPHFFHDHTFLQNEMINNNNHHNQQQQQLSNYSFNFPQPHQQNHHQPNFSHHSSNFYFHPSATFNHIQNDTNLKLPTTPTRSKSLSPSLRCVIQPPRLRHKQQRINGETNVSTNNTKTQSSTTNGTQTSTNTTTASSSNSASYFLTKEVKNVSNDSEQKKNSSATYKSEEKNSKVNSAHYFEPISDKNDRPQSPANEANTSLNKITKEDDDCKEKQSEVGISKASQSSNINISKIVIETPAPPIQKPIPKQPSIKKDNEEVVVAQSPLRVNGLQSEQHEKTECSNVLSEDKNTSNEFKLPLNVRRLNLLNFPPNQSPNSKRQFSITMQKIRNSNSLNVDKSLNVLKKSIQFIFNEKFKTILDDYTKEFIEPAFLNLSQNCGENSISNKEISYLLSNILDEAKCSYFNEILNDPSKQSITTSNHQEEPSPVSTSTTSLSSSLSSTTTMKRKQTDNPYMFLDDDDDENVDMTKLNDGLSVNKKLKETSDLFVSKHTNGMNETKRSKFASNTKFVLGKLVNDIYKKYQQQQQVANNTGNNANSDLDEAESDANSNSIHSRSIYSNYPSLFRYEADQSDRQWLYENSIIKRKNLKCFILVMDDVEQLFNSNFYSGNLNESEMDEKKNIENDKNSINTKSNNDTSNGILFENKEVLFSKKLKPFKLPDFILYKLNKKIFS